MTSKSLSAVNLRKEVLALKAAQKLKLQQLQKQKEERKLLKKLQKQQEGFAKENQSAGNLLQSSLAIPSKPNVQLSIPYIVSSENPTTTRETESATSKPSSSISDSASTSDPNVVQSESPTALALRRTCIDTNPPQNDSIPSEGTIPSNNQGDQVEKSMIPVEATPMVTPPSMIAGPATAPPPPPYLYNTWGLSWNAPSMIPPYFYPPLMAAQMDPYATVNRMPLGTWSSWVPPPYPYQYCPSQPSFPIPSVPCIQSNTCETAQLSVPAKLKVEAFTPATKKAQSLLSMRPLDQPSPYSLSHEIMSSEFVLVKPNDATSTFGLTLKLEMANVLVDPALLAPADTAAVPKESAVAPGDTVSADAVGASTAAAGTAVGLSVLPAKRLRRRRVCYTVLWVQDPSIHNERVSSLLPGAPSALLQKGDIILSIGGTSVEGFTFSQACALFKECKKTGADDAVIRCSLSIARYTPEMQKKLAGVNLPSPVAPSTVSSMMTGTNTQLSAQEIMAFVDVLFRALHAEYRVLGAPIPTAEFQSSLSMDPTLMMTRGTDGAVVLSKWTRLCKNLQSTMLLMASNHWSQEWGQESPEVQRLSVKLLTDAQRSALRQLPPCSTRCRCGSEDHLYANHIQCPLYSNVRRVEGAAVSMQDPIETSLNRTDPLTEDEMAQKSRALTKTIPRDLNVVEKAYCDRFVRSRTEKQNELTELVFVERMEDIQRTVLGQAHRAPSLTTMVLSAVADLESEFAEKALWLPIQSSATPPHGTDPKDRIFGTNQVLEANDSDDEDDVPLSVLGARYLDPSPRPPKKPRIRETSTIHPMFIARLVQFISYRWGHVFREPTNDEYAW
jgi:hypothetical protein